MAQFGAAMQTVQVSTGNFRTTIDTYQAGLVAPYNINGARNPLGEKFYDNSGATLANPSGVGTAYRYVRYLSTANPTLTGVNGPFPVYWTDATFTIVSPVSSEAVGGLNSVAGLCMPNLLALPLLTAATLTAQLAGNFCWIAVSGYVSGAMGATGGAAGDALIGSATNFTPGRVASGTAPTQRVIGFTTTALGTPAAGLQNVILTIEN